jgi:hypothetical protein
MPPPPGPGPRAGGRAARPVWAADGKTISRRRRRRLASSAVYSFGLDGNYKPLTDAKLRLATAYAAAEAMTIARNGQLAITWPRHPSSPRKFTRSAGDRRLLMLLRRDHVLLLQHSPSAIHAWAGQDWRRTGPEDSGAAFGGACGWT